MSYITSNHHRPSNSQNEDITALCGGAVQGMAPNGVVREASIYNSDLQAAQCLPLLSKSQNEGRTTTGGGAAQGLGVTTRREARGNQSRGKFTEVANNSNVTPRSSSVQVPTQGAIGIPNVLIFGESGAGKSSVLNMVSGVDMAKKLNGAMSCTFESAVYSVEINDAHYKLWDTTGLNEREQGSVHAEHAMKNLQDLVQNMEDGVSLLVYCVSGGRIGNILKINYDLFYDIICQSQVPVIVIVTGLENEDIMESWWTEKGSEFKRRGMEFAGHACVTITRGRIMRDGGYMFDKEFEESTIAMRELIQRCCSRRPWRVDRRVWLGKITKQLLYYNEMRERVILGTQTKESPGATAAYGFLKSVMNVALHDAQLGWASAASGER